MTGLRLAIALALGALAGCATSPPLATGPANPTIAALERHIAVLSDDGFAGRAPATIGETQTLDYLQAEWQAAGLTSGTLDPENPWRAPFRAVHFSDGREANTFNLVGRIKGTDPTSGAVLLLAHYDHLGVCGKKADRICNGAVDNASGIAIVTEVARRLAAGPRMRRDIYVLATGAEEWGLLGARAFAEAPPVPVENFVAAFNIDTEGLAPAGSPIVVIGEEGSPLDGLIAEVAGAKNIAVVDPTEANAQFLRRQDGWALLQAGIPSVMVSAAFSDLPRLFAFLDTDYHRPGDEADIVELGAAAEMVDLHVELVRAAADPARLPRVVIELPETASMP